MSAKRVRDVRAQRSSGVMQETNKAHPALILSTWMRLPVMAASAAAFLRICPPPSNMLPGTQMILQKKYMLAWKRHGAEARDAIVSDVMSTS